MRIVRHPNIVQLKAFYYSNGERVSMTKGRGDDSAILVMHSADKFAEGRSLSQPRSRIRA